VRVNCAALPGSLIESELFGHERGAFTGAVAMRQGRFELADGGTIFLDEIGDLQPELQAKLLRVLQEGEFERVGSSRTRRVDVRVIAATHVDLETAVAEGRFRADLYYRLSVFPVTLPPLRERPDDVTRLVWHFIERHQHKLAQRIDSVPAEVMQALRNHDWPGNIRELENVIERALIRTAGSTLQLDHPLRIGPRRGGASRLASCSDTLDDVQRCHIERVLRECGGRINGAGNAAVRLGIHPNTLRYRIKKLGLVVAMRQSGERGTQCSTSRMIDHRGPAALESRPRIQKWYSSSMVPSRRFRSIHVSTNVARSRSPRGMANASGTVIGLGAGTTTEYCGYRSVQADPRSAGSANAAASAGAWNMASKVATGRSCALRQQRVQPIDVVRARREPQS
jgi:hypothetical protein